MTPATGALQDGTDVAVPQSLGELFLAFNRLALQGFGGVLPVAQRELVERRNWLTKDQFVEMLAISQVLPGPNVVNLALMFGDRSFGTRGAMAALGGMLMAPMVIVLALTALYVRFDQYPMVTGALRGMGAVAAGLILSTGLKLLGTLRRNAMGLPICLGFGALTLIGTAWLRIPLVWVIAGLGSVAIVVAWWRLKAAR
ncbi:chromate transporter [Rhizobacter sp. Root404]|jgi:chromate transporter|uniref:chromate transporter n=1 Tax=Rhizobacter sp. Root404 TaxID=1736528 RepID=UPI0006FF3E8A|nr:chromate transporter [Rhizobacter sp. Root404]KQW36990.1 chromate transporter [Rhizobacter sp. Root404]